MHGVETRVFNDRSSFFKKIRVATKVCSLSFISVSVRQNFLEYVSSFYLLFYIVLTEFLRQESVYSEYERGDVLLVGVQKILE